MKHKNLKKLMFLMVLMLGVGQAAQAKRLYADVEQIKATEKGTTWTFESESGTFAWTNDGSYITLFASETGFADYNNLCFQHGNMDGHIDFMLIVEGEEQPVKLSTNGFWSPNQNRIINIKDFYDGDLTAIREVRLYGYADNGSVVLSDIYLTGAKKLNFNEGGVAEVQLSDFYATGGVTIDLEQNTVSCNGTAGTLVLDLNNEDFSNVASIVTSWNTNDSEGFTDLFGWGSGAGCEISGVNTWSGNPYNIDFDSYLDSNPGIVENSKNIVSITFKTYTGNGTDGNPAPKAGTAKFNSLLITKNLINATQGNEITLRDLPFNIKQTDGKFLPNGTPIWNMNVESGEIYGDCSDVEKLESYADLGEYEEIRLYQTSGTARLRFWFFNAENTNYETIYAESVEGKDYAVVNIADVKTKCGGKAWLIGAKTEGGTPIVVSNITVINSNAINNYVLTGRGELNANALAALDDANATVIDAIGITKATTLTSANPNCLFIAKEGILNQNNVLVKGEGDTYTCANLELTPGYPFRAPYEFTATAANTQKTVNEGGHSTLVLPYEAAMPNECEAYTVTGVNEQNKLVGEAIQTIPANKPVLLENAGTYDFSAINATVAATPAELTNGILTGVYDNNTKTPVGSYALQTQDGVQAFYHAISEEVAPTMTPFTAYLTDDASNQANVNRLIFDFEDNDVTGIEQVEAAAKAATVVEIYDLSGRKVSAPVKGINLMKMSDGTVKKVIVK